MKESTFYQGILEEGRMEGQVEEARKFVLRLARKRFGPPTEQTETAINAITDLERLERLLERVVLVSSWEELLTEV